MKPLHYTLKIVEDIGRPVVVHATNPPREDGCAEILNCLGKGDIFCHVFHGKGDTNISEGKVQPDVLEARKRGVMFDAVNGSNHFDFAVAHCSYR